MVRNTADTEKGGSMEPRFIRMREEAAAIGVLSPSPLTSQGLDALVEVCGHFMVYTKAPRLDALVPRLESEVAVFMDAQPGHLGVNFDVDHQPFEALAALSVRSAAQLLDHIVHGRLGCHRLDSFVIGPLGSRYL